MEWPGFQAVLQHPTRVFVRRLLTTCLARIPPDVIDPIRNPSPDGPTGEVVIEHRTAVTPPTTAGVLAFADPFFLLGIHADHRQSMRQIPPSHTSQVPELTIAIGVAGPRPTLAVGPQAEPLVAQQASDGAMTRGATTPTQGDTQLADGLVRPLQPGHRVSGDAIPQQVVQVCQ